MSFIIPRGGFRSIYNITRRNLARLWNTSMVSYDIEIPNYPPVRELAGLSRSELRRERMLTASRKERLRRIMERCRELKGREWGNETYNRYRYYHRKFIQARNNWLLQREQLNKIEDRLYILQV